MGLPWISIGEWSEEIPHADYHRNQDCRDNLALDIHLCDHTGPQTGGDASLANGIIDDLGCDEIEYSTRNQRGDQVCRQIVVEEALSVHEVEGEVVTRPADHEEAGVSEHSVSDSCR